MFPICECGHSKFRHFNYSQKCDKCDCKEYKPQICDCGGIIQEIEIADHKILQCDKCGKYHERNCD